MKVDVVQASDISFKRWQWWSNWIDVLIFVYGHDSYLLQMRVSRTNAKRFNAVNLAGRITLNSVRPEYVSDLTQMTNKEGRSNG